MVIRTGDTRPPRQEACDGEPSRGWTARTEAGKLDLGGAEEGLSQPRTYGQDGFVGVGLRSPGQPIAGDQRSGFPGYPWYP